MEGWKEEERGKGGGVYTGTVLEYRFSQSCDYYEGKGRRGDVAVLGYSKSKVVVLSLKKPTNY